MKVYWWGWQFWRWRYYHVRHPEWGWQELLIGPVSFVWSVKS